MIALQDRPKTGAPPERIGIPVGYTKEGRPIFYRGPGNLICLAPARSGKQRDILTPVLLSWPFSAVVIDPKGELSTVTHRQRKKFGKVIYLDPYALLQAYIKGARSSRYNFLGLLNPKSNDFAAYTKKLADALVWRESNAETNFFTGGAADLCGGISMALIRHAMAQDRTLVTLRSIITGEFQGGVDVYTFARAIMANSDDLSVRQMLARYALPNAEQQRSLSDVIATADQQTSFLSDPALAASLNGSDFRFSDLKNEVVTVYVVLPLNFLDVCGKYFRLIMAGALAELLSCPAGVPVLMPMDEFFQLGYLKAIENAMSMSAGLGVQLWPFLQDFNQLSPYGQVAETFIANAGVRMWFAPRDEKTAQYLSSQTGQVERRVMSRSVSFPGDRPGMRRGQNPPSTNISYSTQWQPVLMPHQTKQLDDDEMLVFIEGLKNVARLKRRDYRTNPAFAGMADPNPYHSQTQNPQQEPFYDEPSGNENARD